jgi:HSP20 family protein
MAAISTSPRPVTAQRQWAHRSQRFGALPEGRFAMRVRDLIPWRTRADRGNGHSLLSLRSDLERVFDKFFHDFDVEPFPAFRQGEFSPKVNVAEDEVSIKVTAELPGIDEKDVEVLLDENILTIKGEKRQETETKEEGRIYTESSYGAFMRSIPMPVEVDRDKVAAAYKKGMLTVTLPKTEKAKSVST